MPQKETHTYKTAGPLKIEADVYRCAEPGARPAILWIHGGALIMGSRDRTPPLALMERLTERYTIVSIDYRLAPETQLADIVGDVEDACAWLVETGPRLFGIDRSRIAVIGMSAGGYLALTAGYRANPQPKAVVAFYGYGDLTGPWYAEASEFYRERYSLTSRDEAYKVVRGAPISDAPDVPQTSDRDITGRPAFYLYCRQNGLWPKLVCGHDPAVEAGWFARFEPLRNVTPTYPPTLLLHGERDTDVPFEQSILMKSALDNEGVPNDFVSHPEWGHAFDHNADTPALDAAFDRVMAFLLAHIG
jgi:acetyl esterase/lipase